MQRKTIIIILVGIFAVVAIGFYLTNKESIRSNNEAQENNFALVGDWSFSEVSPSPSLNGVSTPVWKYDLRVDAGESSGTLSVDGYQTMMRTNIKLEKLNDSVNIIFDSYRSDNVRSGGFIRGDVLMTLYPTSEGNLSVEWYKLKPNVPDNKQKALFTRPTKTTGLTDEEFVFATGDLDGRVLVRGDINNDGFEDAIVESIFCGASCSISLAIVFNKDNKAILYESSKPLFEPAYQGSSAAKSEIQSAKIDSDGIISFTGKGLDQECFLASDDEKPCTEEKWNEIKTVYFKFDGTNIVQIKSKSPAETN